MTNANGVAACGPTGCVCDVPLGPALSVPAEASLATAAEAMVATGVSAALIVDDEGVQRILTEHDITEAVAAELDLGTAAVTVATPHPVAVGLATPLLDALAVMIEQSVRDLPVLAADGSVAGVLTIGAALEAVLGAPGFPGWLSALRFALRVEVADTRR